MLQYDITQSTFRDRTGGAGLGLGLETNLVKTKHSSFISEYPRTRERESPGNINYTTSDIYFHKMLVHMEQQDS